MHINNLGWTLNSFDSIVINNNNDPLTFLRSLYPRPTRFLIDQTDYLNIYSKFDIKPTCNLFSKNTNKSFVDLCLERADTLRDKPLLVLWSGGVDSTCTICSLLMKSIKFEVLTIKSNIQLENNYMLNVLKSLNIVIHYVDSVLEFYNVMSYLSQSMIILDSELDMFWRPYTNLANIKHYNTYMNYLDFRISNVITYEYGSITHTFPLSTVDIIKNWIEKCPIQIKNTLHFLWYVHLTCTYSQNKYKHLMFCNSTYVDNFLGFYDTIDFHTWALYNVTQEKLESMEDPYEYKKELKEIIYEYNGDKNYRNNKVKKESLPLNGFLEVINTPLHLKAISDNKIVKVYLKQRNPHIQLLCLYKEMCKYFAKTAV